jgi:hypothetical protein
MKGRTTEDIKYQMTKDKQRLEQLFSVEFELIDSCINEDAPKDVANPALWFMGKSISMMADADLVYFSKGWEGATGCLIEQEIAKSYNVKRLYYNNVKNDVDFNKIFEHLNTISKMESNKKFMLSQGHIQVANALSTEIGKLHAEIEKIVNDSGNAHIYKTQWDGIHEAEDKIKILESLRDKYVGQKGFTFVAAIDEDIYRLRVQIFNFFKEMARRLD